MPPDTARGLVGAVPRCFACAEEPRSEGVTIAHVTGITYGKRADDPALVESGVVRAEAMAYRDARGQARAEHDWLEIEGRLLCAYQQLKAAIAGR